MELITFLYVAYTCGNTYHGGCRGSHLWVTTFICSVEKHLTSTQSVRVFHHTTTVVEKVCWWVLDRSLGTSSRESLPSTVFVLHLDLLQVDLRSIRCSTCCTCDLCSMVRVTNFLRCSKLSHTGSTASIYCLCCYCCCCCCYC